MNFFDNIGIDKSNEIFTDLLKSDNIRIERIESFGQSSPENFWYEQDENEWVMILVGEAIIEFETYEIKLQKNDYLDIPAKVKHRVKSTLVNSETLWIAVFYK